jgi:hypothetical protein
MSSINVKADRVPILYDVLFVMVTKRWPSLEQ